MAIILSLYILYTYSKHAVLVFFFLLFYASSPHYFKSVPASVLELSILSFSNTCIVSSTSPWWHGWHLKNSWHRDNSYLATADYRLILYPPPKKQFIFGYVIQFLEHRFINFWQGSTLFYLHCDTHCPGFFFFFTVKCLWIYVILPFCFWWSVFRSFSNTLNVSHNNKLKACYENVL